MSGPSIFLTHTQEDLRLYYDPEALERLRGLGRVVLNPLDRHLSSTELGDHAKGCQFIISEWGTGADAAFFRQAEGLVALIRSGVEIRNVDVAEASASGVLVVNTPGLYIAPVVELVIAFMVCLARDVVNRCVALRSSSLPSDRFGVELRGKTLGLVGYGDIARGVARVARCLGMRVLYADPYVTGEEPDGDRVEMYRLLADSDFVSLHARWTPATENLMGGAAFRRMRRTAYFINTARGALVDEAALFRALQEGWIAGAALDVFRNEPEIVGNRLLQLPNVIATPHIGGITPETMRAQALRTVEIVAEILAGKTPAGAVNARDVLSRGT